MYAIVDIAGQQFKVEKDKKVFVHRLDGKEGSKVEFDQVLLIDNDKDVTVGAPTVSGAMVTAKIIEHVKGDKVIVFKKKRRKGYKKKNGHRQFLTQIQIEDIIEKGAKPKASSKKEEPKKAEKKSEEPKASTKKESKKEAEASAPKEKPASEKKTETKKTAEKKTAEKKTSTKKSEDKKPAAKKASESKSATAKKTTEKKSAATAKSSTEKKSSPDTKAEKKEDKKEE